MYWKNKRNEAVAGVMSQNKTGISSMADMTVSLATNNLAGKNLWCGRKGWITGFVLFVFARGN